ncbi:MAG: hypothetical protein JEY79_17345 [Pseudodesulfovibrio sp.]|nr:hypothetical protein [Pseudodesulfovibrio sp.]
MGQIITGSFTSDGNAANLILGFVPDRIQLINANAADTEVMMLDWFKLMGDSKEIWHYIQDNDAGGDVTTPAKQASDGYVAEYNESTVGNYKSVTFDEAGGAADDLFTVSAGHGFVEGEKVRLVESGGLATGLSEGTTYYVKYLTPTTFQVALTSGGTAVAMTGDGTAPNYVFSLDNLKTSYGIAPGGQGVTISGTFMGDGDVIYFEAVQADRSIEFGEING